MIRVFCDFDGTVCSEDVGERFFRTFAGRKAEENVRRLLNQEITMQAWLTDLCDSLPSMTRSDFQAYVDQFSLDPHFREFAHFCDDRDVSVTILSDGLDGYVQSILSSAGLGQKIFFANHVDFIDGTMKISFPYADSECTLCGNCKRNHMLNTSADEDALVYVGDGFSDRCPVRYADFIFAKGQLIKYCQQQNISFYEFKHFGDVQAKLGEILQRKRIRHRQEAAMARREVFMQG
jgi:2-hydroxy-3-keto-5-methylthiopentenyl-1-phosphate phosphatase